jgi:cephalosporin hydroxylase
MDDVQEFARQVARNIDGLANDHEIQRRALDWMMASLPHRYSYNFAWMGLPIIQYPQDIVAMQEIIWRVRPDLIIETGVARGGSLVYYASLLELIGNGRVIGIDIDIRPHNRAAIESHPMAKRIELVEGSSTSENVLKRVRALATGCRTGIVVLDSNHTHDHVLAELRAYAEFVSVGSYCVVMDTIVEDLPSTFFGDRPWSVGNNPKTAVKEFVKVDTRFEIDSLIPAKLQITVAPDGYLCRVR